MKFPRVLAESEDFFAGLQHPDSPVQIRSAPLIKELRNAGNWHFSFFNLLHRSTALNNINDLKMRMEGNYV